MNDTLKDLAKRKFEEFQNTDYDYLIIARGGLISGYGIIPSQGPLSWETVDEAIEYCLNHSWDEIYIYDLYSKFETALVKSIHQSEYLEERKQ